MDNRRFAIRSSAVRNVEKRLDIHGDRPGEPAGQQARPVASRRESRPPPLRGNQPPCLNSTSYSIARARLKGFVTLRQSYHRVGKYALIAYQRYAHAKQFKRARRELRKLRRRSPE